VEAVDGIASWLELWMLGQLALMAVVGVGSYIALLLLGVGNAGALGLIAGLTEAVPYLGPFIGAVPAILVALTHGLMTALWTAAAYLVLHIIEGYVVGPILQRRFARIPPAVILSGIFACQLIFGFGGMVLAAPLTVALFAVAKILYLRDTLSQKVELPSAPKLEP
jgi:predicted PurR-regulated permease PerM